MFIEKANGEIYLQCRIPGIVVTEDGTLFAYYECRRTKWDWAEIDIKIIKSTDEGETWETVTVIEGKGHTLNNPVMFVTENELHFLFFRDYKEMFHCVSTDGGKTFSEPQPKSLECDFFYSVAAVGPGHGIVHNGKMVVPIWFGQNSEDPKAHRPSILSTLYSTDGEEWHIGDIIGEDILVNPSECALAVTADNKVLISIRNENECHQRALALSEDGTGNWENLHFDPQLPDPICMGSMCHANGKIYHINCNSSTERVDLTVKISDDCFKTCESIYIDTPAGYSDVAVKGNKLYAFYERDCVDGGLYFKKITL